MKTVLITGGTGLVGSRLTEMLLEQGYAVTHLSRKADTTATVKTYAWDIPNGKIDKKCLREADYIVHLAGAGIADQRWTTDRKKEILSSRTDSILLIAKTLKSTPHHIQALVSASGISYYGTDTGDIRLTEQSSAGTDFLAEVSVRWEAAADAVAALGIRTVKLRTGIVLSDKGGALPKLVAPIRWGAGAALGSGKQFQSWIHLDDLCRMYIAAIEQSTWNGAYNAVAPLPTTNAELTQLAAKQLYRPLYLPNIPAWALQLAFGEMAQVVTGGNYIINQRIATETSFQYQFPDLKKALANLLH
ncbi:MAG: TIGR01777 family oxidoreductase [Spirosomataceae bacterium]